MASCYDYSFPRKMCKIPYLFWYFVLGKILQGEESWNEKVFHLMLKMICFYLLSLFYPFFLSLFERQRESKPNTKLIQGKLKIISVTTVFEYNMPGTALGTLHVLLVTHIIPVKEKTLSHLQIRKPRLREVNAFQVTQLISDRAYIQIPSSFHLL